LKVIVVVIIMFRLKGIGARKKSPLAPFLKRGTGGFRNGVKRNIFLTITIAFGEKAIL